MYELYFKKFTEKVPLSETEKQVVHDQLSVKKLRKGQYLLQEGDVARVNAFVEKGLLRLYRVDDTGSEHVVFFALEGGYITDLYSFLTGAPSEYCIDAVEASELVITTREARDELIERCPKYQHYMLQVISDNFIRFQNRITACLSMSLDERYKYLLDSCPNIALRAPQYMIASYMGMAPETLSRVKHRVTVSI